MNVLVWQWGRRGAGPRYAAELAQTFNESRGVTAFLSLSDGAELLKMRAPPACELPVRTYSSIATYAQRLLAAPVTVRDLVGWVRRERIDVAVCAMPAALDVVMAAALRLAGVPYGVVVHETELHPGDHYPSQFWLQRLLLRGAAAGFALSAHVDRRIQSVGLANGKPIFRTMLPPFHYGSHGRPPPPDPRRLRLLHFGRLLAYKGLDLLADSLALLGPRSDLEVRVVGSGPECPALDRLRALPGVSVENRWVEEDDVASLIDWADAFVLPYRAASQSGVAAMAIAARRWIVATRVGGLAEQLEAESMAILCEPSPEALAEAVDRLCRCDRSALAVDDGADLAWCQASLAMIGSLRSLIATPVRADVARYG